MTDYNDLREKFAFHMADIATNLQRLAKAYESEQCDTSCLADMAELFFVHSVPHLVAAGQIYEEIPNVFDEQKAVHDWASFVDDEVAK